MVEVYKTNVQEPEEAERLLFLIHTQLKGVCANFDLTDCDRILRVDGIQDEKEHTAILSLASQLGFAVTPLP